jgi:hypothetical protein
MVARSLSEPATRRIDADRSQGMLATLRRLIQAAHVLRLDVQDDRQRPPWPALEPLAAGLDAVLSGVEVALRARPEEQPSPEESIPDLRARYLTFARAAAQDVRAKDLLEELDEIVDAANSLVSLASGESSAPEDAGRSQAEGASLLHS